MDEKKKNLCAMIPESLHIKVREEQEQLALTLSEYVEKIIREHFEGDKTMANGTRTLALQIPEELFVRIKAQRAGVRDKATNPERMILEAMVMENCL